MEAMRNTITIASSHALRVFHISKLLSNVFYINRHGYILEMKEIAFTHFFPPFQHSGLQPFLPLLRLLFRYVQIDSVMHDVDNILQRLRVLRYQRVNGPLCSFGDTPLGGVVGRVGSQAAEVPVAECRLEYVSFVVIPAETVIAADPRYFRWYA